MQQKFKIAQLEDLEPINQLLRLSKSYWGYDEEFLDIFIQKLGITPTYLKNNHVHLLYLDEKLSGFYSFSFHDNQTYELDNFFLHPDFIGQGLGRMLWQQCCRTAKELGAKEFIIWSDPNAETFYLKMGCVKIGTRPSPLMPNRHPAVFKYTLLPLESFNL